VAKSEEPPFVDYYQVLQLQPDADSGLVDQAYWYLARVYNERPGPIARAKLDDLNEAYSVLRSPALREAYDKIRDDILGVGAPPRLPRPQAPRPPLPIMSRQQVRSTLELAVAKQGTRRWTVKALLSKLKRTRSGRGRKRTPAGSNGHGSPQRPISGRDLDTLFQSTEAARARLRDSSASNDERKAS
jgi:curved DNA-binding protein CbpA